MLISILSPYTLKTVSKPNFGIFRVSTKFFDLDSTNFNHQPTFCTSKRITNEAFLDYYTGEYKDTFRGSIKWALLNPGMNLNVETRYITYLLGFWLSKKSISYIKSATPICSHNIYLKKLKKS